MTKEEIESDLNLDKNIHRLIETNDESESLIDFDFVFQNNTEKFSADKKARREKLRTGFFF